MKIRPIRLSCMLAVMLLLSIVSSGSFRSASAAGPICSVPGTYATITLALADPGCTTIQIPGGVTESFVINRTVTIDGLGTGTINSPSSVNLNLEPQTGSATPFASIISVRGAGTTATIKNLTIDGLNNGATGCNPGFVGIVVRDNATVTIANNTIRNIEPQTVSASCASGLAIVVGRTAWGSSGVASISNNAFVNYLKTAISTANNSEVSISGNTITGRGLMAGDTVAQNGIQIADSSQPNVIINNIITGNAYNGTAADNQFGSGILITNTTNVAVTGNNLDGNQVNLYTNASQNNIQNNCITNSTGPTSKSDPTIQPAGLYVDTAPHSGGAAASVNAPNNWWGSADGPSYIANPPGRGDRIVVISPSTLAYVPFITAKPSGCFGEKVLSTQTPTATATSTPIPVHLNTIGVYRNGTFLLRLHNTQGAADLSASFSAGTKPYPVVGDWAGVGFDTIGVLDQTTGSFSLRNSNTAGAPDEQFVFGNPNDTPLSGRWLSTATHDGVGVFRPINGILYVKNALSTGFSDHAMVLGNPGDQGVAGDWTGRGYDGLGVFRPGSNTFYLVNQVGDGVIFSDINFLYGSSTDVAINGDWIAQGHDGVGTFRPMTGNVYLKNALVTGVSDISFVYGVAGDQPIAGHWQLFYPPIAPASSGSTATAAAPQPTRSANSAPGGNQIGG